ncbi:hypothetical protein OOZ15_13650 [Galbibacter sp. EGI 63066]|uniref:hypothetical protein n=1 Tax=Galbibacter sp. EGI 63066 TaxID=2993559 RepID=UPI00224988E8|nr:hypothetical protein [Galbibacter sp. EGI 63066]MCX2680993.1 hypothetical protein [Galbibacter sp. EGI 63066]
MKRSEKNTGHTTGSKTGQPEGVGKAVANRLQAWEGRLCVGQKKLALVLFCLLLGCCNTYLLVSAIADKPPPVTLARPGGLRMPGSDLSTDRQEVPAGDSILKFKDHD